MIKIEKDNLPEGILPMVVIILDGWGLGKPSRGNAIFLARTPRIDSYMDEYPFTTLEASGKHVGLPTGQAGNSEAGHMNIGAGRIVDQDSVKISKSINDGTFFKNSAFKAALRHVKKNKSTLHLMGMLSNGMSAHSDPDHLLALLVLARKEGIDKVRLHLFTDGRDSPPFSALKLVERLEKSFKNNEKIASITGRFYAMDRTKKWERTKKVYEVLTKGDGKRVESATDAITESYNKKNSDEYVEPYVICERHKPCGLIRDNDSVIFFNLRSDRARQLAKAFVQKDFNQDNPGAFVRDKVLKNLTFVAMTDFGPDLDNILSAYPSVDLLDTLPMLLFHLKQLYLAETEKYAHVTYFMNGGYSGKVNGEVQTVIKSPNVKSYDQTPAMSSEKLADLVVDNLTKAKPNGAVCGQGKYDFTLVNFAAPDMVGHTGNLRAGIQCAEAVDKQTGRIVSAYLKAGGTVIITADHGNLDEMVNIETNEVVTEHTLNPVPFILINDKLKDKIRLLKKNGVLGDIAPTILKLLNLKKSGEMREGLIK